MENEKNKRDKSCQTYFYEKMANKIYLSNENLAIGGSIYVMNLFSHF